MRLATQGRRQRQLVASVLAAAAFMLLVRTQQLQCAECLCTLHICL